MHIHRRLATLAATCALAAFSAGASAAMLTASYSGTVSGYVFLPQVLDDFPVGTPVSWEFTFDDSFRSLDATGDVFGAANQAISGWAQVGADRLALDHFGLFSIRFNGGGDYSITDYRALVSGTGPGISNGGEFYGLFLTMNSLLSTQSSPLVGYAYSSPGVTSYGYLAVEGAGSIVPAQVPVPGTAWLALPALVGLAWQRRKPAA